MSDSEDDYMSDKLLVGCEKEDVRPGLLFKTGEKRKLELYKKQLEQKTVKKPKSYREREQEARERGLQTAISSDNKGFKLLEKMGYKSGTALGKTSTGLKEPIDIKVKDNSSGVGRESHLKEIISAKRNLKENKLKNIEANFRNANAEKTALILLRKDFFKAQRICEELDFRKRLKQPFEEYFWTKETMKKLKKSERGSDEEDEEEEEEEEEWTPSEDNLIAIIEYLRNAHCYCMYCAISGEDEDDLKQNCPGPYRDDHDDF